jgi:hypothetical protein
MTKLSPSGARELDRRIEEAAAALRGLREYRNTLLPELPADLLADLDLSYTAECPHVAKNGTECRAGLNGYADTHEVSPVLGWGPSEEYNYNQGKPIIRPIEKALWFGDYEWSDQSDPISEIRCTNGHLWQVPADTDRNV